MKIVQIKLSEIIIGHMEITSFPQLLAAVRGIQSDHMLYLDFDVKPDYRDTPRNWKWQMEAALEAGKESPFGKKSDGEN